MTESLLRAHDITKKFGDFTANDAVNFSINKGEIHALLGENGAGKSTFVKMLYGVMGPDSGHFEWQGETVQIPSPKAARAMGIAMVFQHFSLFSSLTVAENIALALDDAPSLSKLSKRIASASEKWGLAIDPMRPVGDLSVGEQQRVEILRCLLQDPKLLIMDEPTSVLTPQESEKLFEVLKRLADEGRAILYISHKLDEIMALAQKATVLRGGQNVGIIIPAESGTRAMAEMMVGDSVNWIERKNTHHTIDDKEVILQIKRLTRPAQTAFSTPLNNINLSLRRGEILGIAGISGNGQEELVEALSGEWICPFGHNIIFKQTLIGRLQPHERRQLGIEIVPEERNGHAAAPDMSLVENTFLTHHSNIEHRRQNWWQRITTHPQQTANKTSEIVQNYDVRTPHQNHQSKQLFAKLLSGGNLQKFIMGRTLIMAPQLAIFAQPTWGVDIGAATEIRKNLLNLASEGCGIIIISQDLEEIFSLSDYIAVLNNGQLSDAKPAATLTAEAVGLLMGGAAKQGDVA